MTKFSLREWQERPIERRVGIKHQISKIKINGNSDGDSNGNSKARPHGGSAATEPKTKPAYRETRARIARTLRVFRARRWPLQNPQLTKTIAVGFGFSFLC